MAAEMANIFGDFRRILLSALDALAAEGALPKGLDASRVAVEPPRDPAHLTPGYVSVREVPAAPAAPAAAPTPEAGPSKVLQGREAVRDVLLDPRHPYTLGLVRSAPDFEYVRESLVPIPGSPPSLISLPAGCRFHPRCEFVEEDCKVTPTPLRPLPGGRATACLHYERTLEAVAADKASQ